MAQTIIVGGGQAGLALSHALSEKMHSHIVLEQAAQAGNAWRNGRWDSFTWVTPNSLTRLPGTDSPAPDPDGFLTHAQIVAYFEDYVARFKLPVRYNVRVTAVEPSEGGYRVSTEAETLQADNVVIATGLYQHPKIPAMSARLPSDIVQLHSGSYRNPTQLPPGAVLIVGSGQSGCQIAEELYQSGRKVYLNVGSGSRVPRRYRGMDCFEWLYRVGFFDQTVDKLPSPKAKYSANPQLSGSGGGHSLNLHQFARDGVMLLGHLQDIRDGKLALAPDLKENLERIDKAEMSMIGMIDSFIERTGMSVPPENLPQLRDAYLGPEILELDLKAAGITSVIWAAGYSFDFSLVKLPVFEEDGYPRQQRGVTDYPGLYFLGLPWLYKRKSGLVCGIGDDADYLAAHILGGV